MIESFSKSSLFKCCVLGISSIFFELGLLISFKFSACNACVAGVPMSVTFSI